MNSRVVRFLQDVVCFGIGRLLLRGVSLGRLDPRLEDRARPWVTFLGLLAAFSAIAAAALWLDDLSVPPADGNLFHNRAQFRDYVARLDLAPLPIAMAIERLSSVGFRCETFADGNAACSRDAKGALCGERQFVDLLAAGKAGAAHAVATRFGRTCW